MDLQIPLLVVIRTLTKKSTYTKRVMLRSVTLRSHSFAVPALSGVVDVDHGTHLTGDVADVLNQIHREPG